MQKKMEKLEALFDFVKKTGLKRLKVRDGDEEIEMELFDRDSTKDSLKHRTAIPSAIHPPYPSSSESKIESGHAITAPMVGTFYASSTPGAPPFVKEGDLVDEETVVGIVEAMKVMNEVKAGFKGKVDKVAIEDGHPVEFGTTLFWISSP